MKADEYLDEKDIEFREVIQDNPTKSCDDAAHERGLETDQIVKSLIIESEGEKLHVLLPGDRTLSEKKLGAEYRMIPPEASKELTGFESGTVHPFSTELHHIVDERILEHEEVSHTVGETKRAVILESKAFEKGLKKSSFSYEVGDFAVSTDEDIGELENEGLSEEAAKFVSRNSYRKVFMQYVDDHGSEVVLNALKAFSRNDVSPEDWMNPVLERAEDQTHMQNLAEHIAENQELPEASDYDLEDVVRETVEDNPDAVEDFREGKDSAVNFFIGQIMQQTNGKADAGEARKLLLEELE